MSALTSFQDYVWFLAGLAWLVAGLGWWQLERANRHWAWLPWSAVAGLAAAGVQISGVLVVPGQRAMTPPMLGLDVAMGGLMAVQAGGWWWSLRPAASSRWATAGRLAIIGLGLVLAALRIDWPQAGGAGLFLSSLGALLCWWVTDDRGGRAGKIPMGLVVLAVLASNAGPLAGTFFAQLRWADFSAEVGMLRAALELLAAGTAVGLLVGALARRQAEEGEESIAREARMFGYVLTGWLLAGLAIASISARIARRDFESAATSRARMATGLLEGGELSACLGASLRLDEFHTFRPVQGGATQYALSHWLTPERVAPLSARLAGLGRANPDLDDLFVATLRNGWVAGVLFPTRPLARAGSVSLERAADDTDLALWESRREMFRAPRRNAYWTSAQAWAPLRGDDGAMLGWIVFEFSYNRWAAPQVIARLQTFAVVTLGVFFCVLLLLHRMVNRQREAASMRARAAATANRTKTTFLATVSHELRTPLQAIRGYSELLETRNESAANRPLFAVLRHQLEVMHRLVGDLLDLSAMEAGALQCVRQPVEVGRLLEELVADYRRPAAAKGLVLGLEPADALPAWLSGDGVRLRQVLGNLLSNAIKYTDTGEVWLRVAVTRVDREACDFNVTVEDTGPGIPAERRSALFQPFSRLHHSDGREGTGLGLALASALARNLGGQLRLLQTGPEGSRFNAEFRWAVVDKALEGEPPAPGRPVTAKSVLVADDNPVMRALFSDYLAGCGLHCDQAATGAAAVAALQHGDYDAAVIDLSMPGMDGCEVVRRVRGARPAGRPLRIVGVSAHAGNSEAAVALAAGMDAFLVKPVELAALLQALGLEAAPSAGPAPSSALLADLDRQFRVELPDLILAVENGLAGGQWSRVVERAHYLANSAFALQAEELGRGCRALESAASANDVAAALRAWDMVLMALRPWLAAAPARTERPSVSSPNQPRPPSTS